MPEASPRKTTQRFLLEVEALVVQANREEIHNRIPKLTKERLQALARQVARIRAEYLDAAFRAQWDETADLEASDLRSRRALYEEAVSAFDALERAITRGYIEFAD